MAPVLQCPDCGEKHPITTVPGSGAFPCQGCGRILKVPEAVAQRIAAAAAPKAGSGAAGGASAAGAGVGVGVAPGMAAAVRPDPGTPRPVPIATAVANPNAQWDDDDASTRAVGRSGGDLLNSGRRGARRPVPRLGSVPWWMRLLLWIIAVPLSFLLVFLIARLLNLFTSDQLSNLFLASDSSRFWPAIRLLPFVALVTAALVQGGVFGLARWRGRREGGTRSFEDLSGPPRPAGRSRATS